MAERLRFFVCDPSTRMFYPARTGDTELFTFNRTSRVYEPYFDEALSENLPRSSNEISTAADNQDGQNLIGTNSRESSNEQSPSEPIEIVNNPIASNEESSGVQDGEERSGVQDGEENSGVQQNDEESSDVQQDDDEIERNTPGTWQNGQQIFTVNLFDKHRQKREDNLRKLRVVQERINREKEIKRQRELRRADQNGGILRRRESTEPRRKKGERLTQRAAEIITYDTSDIDVFKDLIQDITTDSRVTGVFKLSSFGRTRLFVSVHEYLRAQGIVNYKYASCQVGPLFKAICTKYPELDDGSKDYWLKIKDEYLSWCSNKRRSVRNSGGNLRFERSENENPFDRAIE